MGSDVYQYCTYVEMMHMKQNVDSFSTKDLVEDGFAESSYDVIGIVFVL